MKRGLLILLLALASLSCSPHSNKIVVGADGDTIPSRYVIEQNRVGEISRGATISRLNKRYGDSYVKQLRAPLQAGATVDSSIIKTYYIYNEQNHLELIVRTEDGIGQAEVKSLIIKDESFTTTKGITINSSLGELSRAYPDAVVVQYDDKLFVFVSSLDLYVGIDKWNIRGYNPNFLVDTPLDSLLSDAPIKSLTVSWDSTQGNILSPEFWQGVISNTLKWLIYELPPLLLIAILFILAKRLLKFGSARIKRMAKKRFDENESIDSGEALKRLGTITGIALGVIDILLWSIFILVLLSKFNINIAPILTSAGILGLAVGFGAQELFRDFISGFFILLENQLRTGDMAIINDTMGMVEKIELRTVTLRDPSGVVHIFQNGKINSLSNMTKEWSAIVLEIGVAYKEDIDQVIATMKDVGKELRSGPHGHLMLGDIEIWGLDSFADSAITIKMCIKTRPMKQWQIKREYQRLLKIRFDKDGIEIPFPHVTVYTGEKSKPMPIELHNVD